MCPSDVGLQCRELSLVRLRGMIRNKVRPVGRIPDPVGNIVPRLTHSGGLSSEGLDNGGHESLRQALLDSAENVNSSRCAQRGLTARFPLSPLCMQES